tara:strand:- start:637 stop:2919 length:2283 start_codon:yes stop_codon:yes gene_type:complete
MTEPLPSQKPNFFGKDRFVPFIGQVEDVNDPKHSNRVKVRCVGYHPNTKTDEQGISTDDLPWSRVGMPTTGAQQSRIGAKHGLLPGSWVWGFFLDGEDAQDPFIVNAFDFTANASDEDNRTKTQSKDGKLTTQDQAFDKIEVGASNQPNAGTRTTSERGTGGYNSPGDKSGDQVTSEADNPCTGSPTDKSVGDALMHDEPQTKLGEGAEASQNYGVSIGDGLCGAIAHARDDVKRKMKEKFPSKLSRFAYGDVVWNAISGNYIDLNGIMMSLAMDLCNLFKQPANSLKSQQEELNRKAKSIANAIPDRDGKVTQEADKKTTQLADNFHGLFQEATIDKLCRLIYKVLMNMNNITSAGGSGSGNATIDGGVNVETEITDVEVDCLTDTIICNIETIVTDSILELSDSASPDSQIDYNYIASILGGLQAVMSFPLLQKYSKFITIFNHAGTMSQDALTKQMGCLNERTYYTWAGAIGSSGGGSSSGSGSDSFHENLDNVGFGGTEAGTCPLEISYGLCEEATEPTPPTKPGGGGGQVVPLPLPSEKPECATNFANGTPNTIVITSPGKNYFFDNPDDSGTTFTNNSFPSIYIPNYAGTPIPVVDRATGELVAIKTKCSEWPNVPSPPTTIIPDKRPDGILTDDDSIDVVLGGVVVANTGFEYCDPKIVIWDRDRQEPNGEASLVTVSGRIVEVVILNNGTGFRRLPEIRITDDGSSCGTDGGFGSILYPIMEVIPRPDSKQDGVLVPVQVIQCPSKNLKNLY